MRIVNGLERTARANPYKDKKFIAFPGQAEPHRPAPMRAPRTRIRRMPRHHRTA